MATREDFFLAIRGDPVLATREDFFMATDTRNLICERYGRNMYMRFRRTLKTAEILFSRNQLTLYRVEFVKQRNTRIPGIFQELKESGALAAEFA